MADQTTFINVSNGDKLFEGYFNGIYTDEIGKITLINSMNISTIGGGAVSNPNLQYFTSSDLTNLDYDGTSAGTTKTNVFVDFYASNANDKVYGIQAYDLNNNSAVDGALWTNTLVTDGTVTENTTQITLTQLSSSSEARTSSTVTNDLSAAKAADFRILVRAKLNSTDSAGGGENVSATLRLTDGTDTVIIKTFNQDSAFNDESLWEVRYDQSADTIDIYDDGVLDQNDVDVSLLSTIKLELVCSTANTSTGSQTSTIDVYGVFSSTMVGTPILQLDSKTTVHTTDNVTVFVETATDNNGTLTPKMSADNGSNYTNVTLINNYGRSVISNTGTTCIGKIEYTISSSLSDDIPNNESVGIFFNKTK